MSGRRTATAWGDASMIRACLRAGLAMALAAACAACASTGATPQPFPRPGGVPANSSAPAGVPGIVSTALSLRGVPYRSGGADPSGFDCSGLVTYVLARHRIAVPRTVPEQFRLGRPIRARSVEPGDLVFFRIDGRGPSHVGIAISPDEFVHAPSSRGVVRVEPLGSRYWSSRFLGARRLAAEQ